MNLGSSLSIRLLSETKVLWDFLYVEVLLYLTLTFELLLDQHLLDALILTDNLILFKFNNRSVKL